MECFHAATIKKDGSWVRTIHKSSFIRRSLLSVNSLVKPIIVIIILRDFFGA